MAMNGLRTGLVEMPVPQPTTNPFIEGQKASLASFVGPMPPIGGSPSGDVANAVGTPNGTFLGTTQQGPIDLLATKIGHDYEIAKTYKQDPETEWMVVHANFRGTANRPVNEVAMGIRSKVTMKVTRVKVAAAIARLREIGFQWNIKPTAEPTLLEHSEDQIKQVLAENLASMENQDLAAVIEREMNVDDMMDKTKKLALDRAARMKLKIRDHLQEDGWTESYDEGLLEFALYGTMIFRGPLSKESQPGRWIRKGGVWAYFDHDGLVSYCPTTDHISVWDFYPSPGAWCTEKLEWAIIRHVVTYGEACDLGDKKGFDKEKIFKILAAKTAQWTPLQWEQSVFVANKTQDPSGSSDRHVILEWWGFMTVEELKGYGGTIPEFDRYNEELGIMEKITPKDEEMVLVNAWKMGDQIIKAIAVDMKPKRLPFFVVQYEKVPKRLFGQGPAWMMEDWQAVLNTVYRAMLDNMAISALPLGWYDKSRVKTQSGELTCGKMFAVENLEDTTIPPVQFFNVPNNTPQLKQLADIANKNIQEATSLRDLVETANTPGGHNRTSSGLSIIGGWADASTRSVQRNIDRQLTAPFIKALYFWEMQFSADDTIKGDFDVVAEGVDSVIAEEIVIQRMNEILQNMGNLPDAKYTVNLKRYFKMLFDKVGAKDEGLIYSDSEAKQLKDEDMQREQQMKENEAEIAKKYQPEMTQQDAMLKVYAEIPDDALAVKVAALRSVATVTGMMTDELKEAIDATLAAQGHAMGGALTDTDQANIQMTGAAADRNAKMAQNAAKVTGIGKKPFNPKKAAEQDVVPAMLTIPEANKAMADGGAGAINPETGVVHFYQDRDRDFGGDDTGNGGGNVGGGGEGDIGDRGAWGGGEAPGGTPENEPGGPPTREQMKEARMRSFGTGDPNEIAARTTKQVGGKLSGFDFSQDTGSYQMNPHSLGSRIARGLKGVWGGASLVGGLATGNPAAIAKGVSGARTIAKDLGYAFSDRDFTVDQGGTTPGGGGTQVAGGGGGTPGPANDMGNYGSNRLGASMVPPAGWVSKDGRPWNQLSSAEQQAERAQRNPMGGFNAV